MPSDDSSSELCHCGHPRASHHWHAARGEACIGNRNLCSCRLFRLPKLCTCGPDEACGDPCVPAECQHPNKQFTGSLYDGPGGRKTWLYYTCPDCKEKLKVEEEPPMTSEEEEELACPHESWEVGSQWRDGETGKWWKSRRCADCRESLDNVLDDEQHDFEGQTEPPPPQPVRRPPYAVAYSVQGHLYEVALPGDAMVRAVDGALVIQHHLGPVAGIVQVLPVINEGGTHAEPDRG